MVRKIAKYRDRLTAMCCREFWEEYNLKFGQQFGSVATIDNIQQLTQNCHEGSYKNGQMPRA